MVSAAQYLLSQSESFSVFFEYDIITSSFESGKPGDGIEGEGNSCGISLLDPNFKCQKQSELLKFLNNFFSYLFLLTGSFIIMNADLSINI